ncbi:hypothetical protein N7523_001127 [Penicillium sp. IBT 18751x]|nr:hypothetical protein N7523_001127 [Penicillium sp. IBT 18751x]
MKPPPTETQYDSLALEMASIHRFTRDEGYSVSTFLSISKNGVKKIVRLCCTRGRVHQPRQDTDTRVRQSMTLAIGCPFDIAIRLRQTNKWEITYEKTLHNHSPAPLSTQHIHRTQELLAKALSIDHSIRQGYTTRQILTGLREEDSDCALIPRDIYNRRKKLSAEFLAGRTPIQALLMELPKDNDWMFRHELDDNGHLTALFCMHRTCLEILRRHPWVISMDCTYKTNRYGLPLLDIVGLASTGQTYYIAFAFIQDEKEDSYEVILRCLAEAYNSLDLVYPHTILTDKERALINAIKTVFPYTKTISCIWHIEMNL